jgi:hypothetical protein
VFTWIAARQDPAATLADHPCLDPGAAYAT